MAQTNEVRDGCGVLRHLQHLYDKDVHAVSMLSHGKNKNFSVPSQLCTKRVTRHV